MARAGQTHREFYVHFVVGDYDSYVDTMARNTVYGTQLEAEALAEVLGRRVRVWQGYPKVSLASVLHIAV